MTTPKVVIILGSGRDAEFAQRIQKVLTEFSLPFVTRVASAHKTPHKLLALLDQYDAQDNAVIYITVAGRSNAMSGVVDANTVNPVISCPPYSDRFGGADIYSSLRMPSGVCPLVILEPEAAALAAAKILGVHDRQLKQKVHQYYQKVKQKVEQADTQFTH
jgi:5-(carboxyamino)imidazole ribonucleotide mutase